MKHQKILNLLNELNNSKFAAKNGTLSMITQNLIMVLEMKLSLIHNLWLHYYLCDYNDAYVLVRDDILIGHQGFTKYIIKSNEKTDDAEDLIMPMYNLIKYNTVEYVMKQLILMLIF